MWEVRQNDSTALLIDGRRKEKRYMLHYGVHPFDTLPFLRHKKNERPHTRNVWRHLYTIIIYDICIDVVAAVVSREVTV